jgi:hypothetical protein
VTISPAGSYVPITTPVVGDHAVDELQPGGDGALPEQPWGVDLVVGDVRYTVSGNGRISLGDLIAVAQSVAIQVK